MNIETANRLYELRKKYGYSQEELAAKLGLSRQAVSKWERAEASPDTDNLVELAKIYNISLDELLNLEKSSEFVKENKDETVESNEESSASSFASNQDEKKDDTIHINLNDGKNNIHLDGKIDVEDDGDQVHIGKDGIHVHSKDGEEVHIGLGGIHIKSNNEDDDDDYEYEFKKSKKNLAEEIIVPLVTFGSIIAYLILGFCLPNGTGWYAYWVVFLLIPLAATLISAIAKKRFTDFAYPVLVAGVYCFMGLRFPNMTYELFGKTFTGFWHPLWVLFFTIPVYYIVFGPIDDAISRHQRKTKVKFHINSDDIIDNKEDN